jgi:hypothetical protein
MEYILGALSPCIYRPATPPPGRLENSELAANSRKKEYSVSLPLCLAGFWLIKGGVGGGGGGGGGDGRRNKQKRQKGQKKGTRKPHQPAILPPCP